MSSRPSADHSRSSGGSSAHRPDSEDDGDDENDEDDDEDAKDALRVSPGAMAVRTGAVTPSYPAVVGCTLSRAAASPAYGDAPVRRALLRRPDTPPTLVVRARSFAIRSAPWAEAPSPMTWRSRAIGSGERSRGSRRGPRRCDDTADDDDVRGRTDSPGPIHHEEEEEEEESEVEPRVAVEGRARETSRAAAERTRSAPSRPPMLTPVPVRRGWSSSSPCGNTASSGARSSPSTSSQWSAPSPDRSRSLIASSTPTTSPTTSPTSSPTATFWKRVAGSSTGGRGRRTCPVSTRGATATGLDGEERGPARAAGAKAEEEEEAEADAEEEDEEDGGGRGGSAAAGAGAEAADGPSWDARTAAWRASADDENTGTASETEAPGARFPGSLTRSTLASLPPLPPLPPALPPSR